MYNVRPAVQVLRAPSLVRHLLCISISRLMGAVGGSLSPLTFLTLGFFSLSPDGALVDGLARGDAGARSPRGDDGRAAGFARGVVLDMVKVGKKCGGFTQKACSLSFPTHVIGTSGQSPACGHEELG